MLKTIQSAAKASIDSKVEAPLRHVARHIELEHGGLAGHLLLRHRHRSGGWLPGCSCRLHVLVIIITLWTQSSRSLLFALFQNAYWDRYTI